MNKLEEMMNKYFGQIMNTKALLVILLVGVALLLIPKAANKNDLKRQSVEIKSEQKQSLYAKELEERLASILSTVSGAKNVSVMVTLENEGEYYYAQNEKTENENQDKDGDESETRTSDESYVLKNDSGGGQSAVLLKNDLPSVSGVLITAKGADNAQVKNNLVSAVRAVLDVKAHRVCVLSK